MKTCQQPTAWRGRFRRAGKLVLGPSIIMCLLGSGPVRDGTDVTAGGGYRHDVREVKYTGGCDTPTATWRYREHIADLGAAVRYKASDSRFIMAAEGGEAIKQVTDGTCKGDCAYYGSEVGHEGFGLHLATRFGYQMEYFGFMGGPGVYVTNMVGDPLSAPNAKHGTWRPFPSLELWFGTRTFTTFIDLFANMAFHEMTLAKTGFQHEGDGYRIAGGAGAGGYGPVGFADVDVKLGDSWWIGLSGDGANADNWATMLRFTYEFGPSRKAPDGSN